MLNFYDTAQSGRTASSTQPGNFFRVFEFLSVPTPYAGMQKLLNPGAMSGVISGLHWYHPPFNWLPQYREPGRVNLNTVFDPAVFQGIMDDYPQWTYSATSQPGTYSWQKLWQGIVDGRRGYNDIAYTSSTGLYSPAATGTNYSTAVPNLTLFGPYNFPLGATGGQLILPTYCANPFRPEGAATLVPPIMPPPTNLLATPNNLAQPVGQEISATMLRPTAANSYVGTAPTGTVIPLLSPKGFDVSASADTFAVTTGNAAWRQTARNPYFQYQAQTRLGNLVTNRSNVFAIWVTVGYFEALPTLPSAANPDGYQLGPEKGSDNGSVERHRAFYIFDRSIPMGFQRGEDLNVDNGILVESMIE